MIFRTPAFWDSEDAKSHLLSTALQPLGAAYGFLSRKRFDLHFPIPMEKPLVCVGNLVTGGAGKTPLALSIGDILKDMGHNPHFLTRGYGGLEKGPLQVAPARDTAQDVGDEALLLVEKAPVWVSANRALGAQMAFDTGASVVVLDDGFQNAALFKDISVLAVDGGYGFGNGRVFPAGPLRENIDFGLSRAHAAVIIGEDKKGAEDIIRKYAEMLPVLRAGLVPEEDNPDVNGRVVFAFAGIGRPEKFKETLLRAGARIEGWGAFPDHFVYRSADLAELFRAAEEKGALVLTTAKDFVRLPEEFRARAQPFRVRLAWENGGAEEIAKLLDDAISKR